MRDNPLLLVKRQVQQQIELSTQLLTVVETLGKIEVQIKDEEVQQQLAEQNEKLIEIAEKLLDGASSSGHDMVRSIETAA